MKTFPEKYDTVYLMLAVFAILLAGQLVWMSASDFTDESDYQTATIFLKHSDEQTANTLNRDFERAAAEFDEQLQAIEKELAQ